MAHLAEFKNSKNIRKSSPIMISLAFIDYTYNHLKFAFFNNKKNGLEKGQIEEKSKILNSDENGYFCKQQKEGQMVKNSPSRCCPS